MSCYAAQVKFDEAIEASRDRAMTAIAEGLNLLARGIDSDMNKLERELQAIKSRVNTLR